MSKKPDFSPFDDWLVYGPAGYWPTLWQDTPLNYNQQQIVARNAALSQDKRAWEAMIDAFEEELNKIDDERARTKKRAKFVIRFDRHAFVATRGGHNFAELHFPCATSFGGAEFGGGGVSFVRVKFGEGDVLFKPRQLKSTTMSFLDMVVEGNLYIRADFEKPANFRRLTVKGTADFSNSSFAECPDFRDIKLDRPPEVARMAVPPPKLERKSWRIFRVCADGEAVAKYRKLKAMALAANDHEKDGEFFAYEMMAKRGVETIGFFPLLLNSLYGAWGGYGQSYQRPLGWLFGSWAAFAFLYVLIIGKALDWPARLSFAAELSFRNAVPLLNSLFRFAPSPDGEYMGAFQRRMNALPGAGVNVDWLNYLGVAEQFFGAILLFLLLLALRNTFRLK